jgi:hypothetical protein
MNPLRAQPKPRVLGIGIDPIFGDVSTLPPGLTPEIIRATIDAEIEDLRKLGYEAESCLVDLGESARRTVESALRARSFDCIVIGAGIRAAPERLMLFEEIINVVHRLAPQSRIAFSRTPADTAEAARRWIKRDD